MGRKTQLRLVKTTTGDQLRATTMLEVVVQMTVKKQTQVTFK